MEEQEQGEPDWGVEGVEEEAGDPGGSPYEGTESFATLEEGMVESVEDVAPANASEPEASASFTTDFAPEEPEGEAASEGEPAGGCVVEAEALDEPEPEGEAPTSEAERAPASTSESEPVVATNRVGEPEEATAPEAEASEPEAESRDEDIPEEHRSAGPVGEPMEEHRSAGQLLEPTSVGEDAVLEPCPLGCGELIDLTREHACRSVEAVVEEEPEPGEQRTAEPAAPPNPRVAHPALYAAGREGEGCTLCGQSVTAPIHDGSAQRAAATRAARRGSGERATTGGGGRRTGRYDSPDPERIVRIFPIRRTVTRTEPLPENGGKVKTFFRECEHENTTQIPAGMDAAALIGEQRRCVECSREAALRMAATTGKQAMVAGTKILVDPPKREEATTASAG